MLVADDNAINRVIASRLLERLECQTSLAENGERALAPLAAEPFDVVLMDCQMPVLDGLEATRQVRAATQAWSGVPIVALTANAFLEDRLACFAAGMNGFVTKPVTEPGLVRALLSAIGQPEARRLTG